MLRSLQYFSYASVPLHKLCVCFTNPQDSLTEESCYIIIPCCRWTGKGDERGHHDTPHHTAGKSALSAKLVLKATLPYPAHVPLSASVLIGILKCDRSVVFPNEDGILSIFINEL